MVKLESLFILYTSYWEGFGGHDRKGLKVPFSSFLVYHYLGKAGFASGLFGKKSIPTKDLLLIESLLFLLIL